MTARFAMMVAAVIVLSGVAATAQQAPTQSPVPNQSTSTTIISRGGGTSSCSQTDLCGSCSISCPAGKAALCVGGEGHSTDANGGFRCDKPPQCSCQ